MKPEPSNLAAKTVPPTPPALASVSGYVAHLIAEIEKAKKQRLDAWKCGNTPIAMAQSKRISRLEAALNIERHQNQKPHNAEVRHAGPDATK